MSSRQIKKNRIVPWKSCLRAAASALLQKIKKKIKQTIDKNVSLWYFLG